MNAIAIPCHDKGMARAQKQRRSLTSCGERGQYRANGTGVACPGAVLVGAQAQVVPRVATLLENEAAEQRPSSKKGTNKSIEQHVQKALQDNLLRKGWS